MAELTEKGVRKLEKIKDFWPAKDRISSVTMRTKYILREVQKDPEFLIDQRSILRPDWERLKRQGLITDRTRETVHVIEGTDRVLYRTGEDFVRITRPSDSDFRSGQIVSKWEFDEMVGAVLEQGGEPPLAKDLPPALPRGS